MSDRDYPASKDQNGLPARLRAHAALHDDGRLPEDWREVLTRGFAECFRVLKPHGTLIFKWAETEIPLAEVLSLTPHAPLFGARRGKATHWYVFMKDAA